MPGDLVPPHVSYLPWVGLEPAHEVAVRERLALSPDGWTRLTAEVDVLFFSRVALRQARRRKGVT